VFYLVFIWILLFAFLLLCGNLALILCAAIFPHKAKIRLDLFQLSWTGYAFFIGIAQLYSLVFPVNQYIVFLLLFLGVGGFVFLRRYPLFSLRLAARSIRSHKLPYILVLTLLPALLAYFSTKFSTHYDTYLYHLNAVKWLSTYPAVPGIVNLHGRLAYNSSFHIFAVYIANGFLLLLALMQWFSHIIEMPKRNVRWSHAYVIFTISFFISQALSADFPSLATDVSFQIFCLLIVFELLKMGERTRIPGSFWENISFGDNSKSWFLLMALTAVAISTKLAGAPLIVLSLVSCFVIFRYASTANGIDKKRLGRALLGVFWLPALICMGLIGRYVILSGWLVYPVPIGNLHLDWSATPAQVLSEYNSIRCWAKMPFVPYEDVLAGGFSYWIFPWLHRMSKTYLFVYLVSCAPFGAIAAFFVTRKKSFPLKRSGAYTLAILLSFIGIAYWLVAAPDFRFGEAYFWILAALLLAPLLVSIGKNSGYRWMSILIVNLLAVLLLKYANHSLTEIAKLPEHPLQFPPAPAAIDYLVPNRIYNGQTPHLIIYMPLNTELCSNGELPCAPYLRKDSPIEERVPGDLSKGFRIIPGREAEISK